MPAPLPKMGKRIARLLTSTELAITLFGLLALAAVPGTLAENRETYLAAPITLLVLLGISTLFCTIYRWKALPSAVIVVHGGVIMTLGGSLIGTRGFVATVNVYEGATVDRFYRADLDRDVPLGLALTAQKIETEFHPVPVQVGVLKEGRKDRLLTLKTGDEFQLDGRRVRIDSLDVPAKKLHLSVRSDDRIIGRMDTSGEVAPSAEFPYQFRLVAYRDPVVKQMWTELILRRDGQELATGKASVNHPFQWGKLSFYNTQIETDRYGRRFVGIQIVHDPGRPVVFAGLTVLALGAALCTARRMYGWH